MQQYPFDVKYDVKFALQQNPANSLTQQIITKTLYKITCHTSHQTHLIHQNHKVRMYYRQSQPGLRGSVCENSRKAWCRHWHTRKEWVVASELWMTKKRNMLSHKENKRTQLTHTHRDSTQPYYVSAPSIWRYIAKTLTETAEPSSEMR